MESINYNSHQKFHKSIGVTDLLCVHLCGQKVNGGMTFHAKMCDMGFYSQFDKVYTYMLHLRFVQHAMFLTNWTISRAILPQNTCTLCEICFPLAISSALLNFNFNISF